MDGMYGQFCASESGARFRASARRFVAPGLVFGLRVYEVF